VYCLREESRTPHSIVGTMMVSILGYLKVVCTNLCGAGLCYPQRPRGQRLGASVALGASVLCYQSQRRPQRPRCEVPHTVPRTVPCAGDMSGPTFLAFLLCKILPHG